MPIIIGLNFLFSQPFLTNPSQLITAVKYHPQNSL